MFSEVNQQFTAGFSHQKVRTEFSSEQIKQLSELINQVINNRTLTAESADSKED